MPIATAISEGCRIPHTAGSTIAAGNVVVIGTDKPLIATHDIANGADGSLAVEGLFAVAKEATTVTFAVGEKVYWDAADNECNDDNLNPLIGWAYEAAGATDTTVKIKLAQVTA
jgi:predicted RecA/RadA family phage recombinase